MFSLRLDCRVDPSDWLSISTDEAGGDRQLGVSTFITERVDPDHQLIAGETTTEREGMIVLSLDQVVMLYAALGSWIGLNRG